jgi:hypothetical protein
MNTRTAALLLLLCLLVPPASYGGSVGEAPRAPVSDGKPSYEEFRRSVGSFPYRAAPERQNQIRTGYQRLQVGATKPEVAAALGEPDYSQIGYSKGPTPRWLGSSWAYYLSKRSDGANSFDPVVEVFFGTDDRAVWIVPSNISGLRGKGSPSRSRP